MKKEEKHAEIIENTEKKKINSNSHACICLQLGAIKKQTKQKTKQIYADIYCFISSPSSAAILFAICVAVKPCTPP